jgi:hypothetical protein
VIDRRADRAAEDESGELDGSGRAGLDGAQVDWSALDRASSIDTVPLLDRDEPLHPERAGAPVPELYPDRFELADPVDQLELRAAWSADQRPEHWVALVNPERSDPRRMVNCADCARAVQRTFDGDPTTAAALHPDGLPLRSVDGPVAGEAPEYTEQWSADRAQPMDYDEIAAAVRSSGGSAIVFGYGPEGGHAFNAVLDESGEVRWVDGQLGEVGDWPPRYRSTFPHTEAIIFEPVDQREAT